MKQLLALIAAMMILPAQAQSPLLTLPYAYVPQWVAATQIMVPLDNSKRPEVLRANSYTGADIPINGNWYSIDLKRVGVGHDAKAVFFSGLLIVGKDSDAGTADLWVAFRAPGSALTCDYYIGQAVEAAPGNGIRSGIAGWFPVVDGVIEVCITARRGYASVSPYHYTPPAGTIPSYGLSMSVQAWVR